METATAAACDAAGDLGSRRAACMAVGIPQATWYRTHRQTPSRPRPVRAPCPQPRALTLPERAAVTALLHDPAHVDQAPATVQAELLDQGTYLCSVSSLYRILRAADEVHERRRQAVHPATVKPELVAGAPRRVWSWDITKLLGPARWSCYYLYVILDIYSRYVTGWMVATRKAAALAEQLIAQTVAAPGVPDGQLTIHSDRGAAMTSKPVALLLADLGVTRSLSRPHVSNDTPYSEAQFKTLKSHPTFPERFGSVEDARSFCRGFFPWYNDRHRHSGLGYHTPADVHHGRVDTRAAARAAVLATAYAAHPERLVRGVPQPPRLPGPAWIKPPADLEASAQ